ncbi:hypothetical protein CDCA_CDCA16G4225 [Cyanidium caldarium]|uniref:DNA polymerase n=1 Tax=Cyanidium caldarium TaxID=2771 RepID=A0AAV9J1K3_CYACA|nr:hypothetical protein CDCA_CDCA16G4225 [Cyanidium caldarium]
MDRDSPEVEDYEEVSVPEECELAEYDDAPAEAPLEGGGVEWRAGTSDRLTVEALRGTFGRPPVPSGFRMGQEALLFNQTACDYVVERGEEGHESAVIRVYGVTGEGHSVLCRVHGFLPYFYVAAPADWDESVLESFREALESTMAKFAGDERHGAADAVVGVSLVERRSVLYYRPEAEGGKFVRIAVRTPAQLRQAANLLRDGHVMRMPFELYDSTIDHVLRFMIDKDMVGCSWVELPAGSYTPLPDAALLSNTQIAVEVSWEWLTSHAPTKEWLRSAPLRILSLDIECAGRKGVFPEPDKDSVIQIACHVSVYGGSAALHRAVFTLNTCAMIPGVHVYSFDDEAELLQAFRNFCVAVDPDILTGYNIVNFDLPYLLNRAAHLRASRFPFLGRVRLARTQMRKTKMSSSAFGTHDSMVFSIEGRVVMDMMQVIIREYKLRSYSLNSVASEFLDEQKEDVHYSIISDLQAGNEHTRRRLAVYCLKDAYLPQRLMEKLLALTNYTELARVTGVPLDWLLSRGHMVKVVSLLHRKATRVGLLVPDLPRKQGDSGGGGDSGPQYEGATVIEPKKGFYRMPIATLDFASLYPSIMMAHNLCYSTLVRESDVKRLRPEDYVRSPLGHCFVRPTVRKGILSVILEELLQSRKVAKRDMAAATEPFLKEVLNGRQMALKISANAVYGFTGASTGKLPCMEISASVTAFGRQMIELTKNAVESMYPGAEVVYGDTDSVMVKFGDDIRLERVMALGAEAAAALTRRFPPPVKLEFEKAYFPYLLISKKRYAGLLWTRPEQHDKMDCKGIESVRRDNCRLVANVVSAVLRKLLVDQDVDGAIEFVKRVVSELLQNKIDLSLLVVSKTLTRDVEKYEAKQAHVFLVEKLRKRDRGSAPGLGDRVPYVIIKGATKDEKAYMRAEDPIYVLENGTPIDAQYYLENMLRKPLERIFSAVMKRPEQLFSGAHTRSIHVTAPRAGSGITKFAKFRLQCVGCRAAINEAELARLGLTGTALCAHCRQREPEWYRKTLHQAVALEKQYNALWTQCQACMGSCVQDVLCSNGDCPIFYRRRKVQKDITEAYATLARFSDAW